MFYKNKEKVVTPNKKKPDLHARFPCGVYRLLRDKEKLKDDSRTEISALQVKVQTAEIQATEASSQVDLLRHQLKHAKDDTAK